MSSSLAVHRHTREASKRNESAGAKRPLARATLPHKINERERRRNRAAIGCEMFFFYILLVVRVR